MSPHKSLSHCKGEITTVPSDPWFSDVKSPAVTLQKPAAKPCWLQLAWHYFAVFVMSGSTWVCSSQHFGSLLSHSFLVLTLLSRGGASFQILLEKIKQGQVVIPASLFRHSVMLESHPFLTKSQSWEDYLKHIGLGSTHLSSNLISITH